MKKIAFVFPVYNEEGNLEILHKEVKLACEKAQVTYEMIFVNNGSCDNSLEIIKKFKHSDSHVGYVNLSRNFGHQGALCAGLTKVRADAVITMDADLEHPPSLIPEMIQLWQEGYDVVYTTKENHHLPFFKYKLTQFYYWLLSKLSGFTFHFGQSDFRLIDNKVLQALLLMPEYHKFLRAQITWLGFRQKGLSYHIGQRITGLSKFSFKNLFSFGLDGIFGFSHYPLRLISLTGFILAGFSLLYMLKEILIPFFLKITNIDPNIELPPGWLTLAGAVFFMGSFQLIALGIIGEYIARIFDQTKNRPNFVIKDMDLSQ